MNLITNAVELIDVKGSVLVSSRNQGVDPGRIAASSLDAGEFVILTIKDTGSGIAEHDLEHIFEPFYTKKSNGPQWHRLRAGCCLEYFKRPLCIYSCGK